MLKRKKILLLSHDATRTGAPILLLNLADLLIKHGYEVEFLLKHGGALEGEFIARAKSFLATRKPRGIKSRLKENFGWLEQYVIDDVNFETYDVIVSNTITNGDILERIKGKYKGIIISYIHELQMATRHFSTPERVAMVVRTTDLFAVPSKAVESHLIGNLSIHPSLICNLNYYIPKGQEVKSSKSKEPDETIVVGALGTTEWRKSPDLFVQTAAIIYRNYPEKHIKFLWQGASYNQVDIDRINYDIEKLGISACITFVDGSADVRNFFNSIDLFFLTSREDPFPLVVLEAANYRIPTICFENTGGACEFVTASKGGYIVSYLDILAAAQKIVWYYDHPDELSIDGGRAKLHLELNYQNEGHLVGQFEELLRQSSCKIRRTAVN